MFGGVKITLIICLTIITSSVLFISYNEYSGRYSIVSTADNGIYIFDKKSTILNRCDGKNCVVIETKLPTKTILNQDSGFQQSKLFESEKPMATTLASNTTNPEPKSDNPENNKVSQDNEKELASPETTSDSKASSDSQATSTSEKTENTTNPSTDNSTSATSKEEKTENQNEDEFIE